MKDWADHRTTKQLWTWNTWTGNLTTMQLPYFNVLQQNTDKNWRNKKHGYDMGFKVKMFSWMSFQKLKQLLFPYKVNFHQRKVQQPHSYNTEYLPRVKQWTKPVFLLFLTNRKSREQTFFSVSPFRKTPPESASLTYPDGIACWRAEKDSTFFFKITKW